MRSLFSWCPAWALLLLATVGWTNQRAYGQVLTVTDAYGTQGLCPKKTYIYTASHTDPVPSCATYNWTVTGGQLKSPNNTNSRIMTVEWEDEPGYTGTLKVQASSCAPSAGNQTSPVKTVFIQSLKNTSVGPITGPATLAFGSTAAVTYAINQVTLPTQSGQSNPVTQYAYGYYWTIPAGWKFSNGHVSDGTPYLINNANGNTITVTPTAGSAGTITVRAADTGCGVNSPTSTVSSQSQPASLQVSRPAPPISIVTSRTPNGGNIVVGCGDDGDIFASISTAGFPAGAQLDNFNWTAIGVVSVIAWADEQTALVKLSGAPGTGQLFVTARYTINGASTSVSASINVTAGAQAAKPEIIFLTGGGNPELALLCYDQEYWVQAIGSGSALTYSWSCSNPNVIITSGSTGNDMVRVRVPLGTAEGPVQLRVDVSSSLSTCAANFATKNFVINRSFVTPQTNPIGLMVGTQYGPNYSEVTCGQPTWLTLVWPIKDLYGNTLTNFRWDVDGVEPPNSANQGSVLASFRSRSQQGGQVTLFVTNSCGMVENYWWQIPVSLTCGTGPIEPEPCDCGGGVRAAYPNPANDALIIEQQSGTVTLRNNQGKAMFQGKPQQGKLVIDTRSLPEGLYYLEHKGDNEGKALRRQISIKH